MTTAPDDGPDWLLERIKLGEVPAASTARAAALAPDAVARRVDALHAADAAELAAYPPGPALAQIRARAAARPPHPRTTLRAGLALGGVAATLAVVLAVGGTARGPTPAADDVEVTRAKGAARLAVYRQVAGGAERLAADAVARAGDVLQLRYDGAGRRFGVIASVDGAGVVTLHFPAREDASTALAGAPTTLAQAYALDDAPRFERFFFLTADAPLDARDVLASLRALAARPDADAASPTLPAAIHAWSLRLRKP